MKVARLRRVRLASLFNTARTMGAKRARAQRIVFDTHPMVEVNFEPMVSNLFRMHPDGSGIEQLTHHDTQDLRATQPRYTPDGEWIIFTSVTPSSRSLRAIPAAGGEPIVFAPGGIYTHGTWQP